MLGGGTGPRPVVGLEVECCWYMKRVVEAEGGGRRKVSAREKGNGVEELALDMAWACD